MSRRPGRGARKERHATFWSRWLYYLSSIPILLTGIRNWPAAVAVFLGLPVRRPLTLELRTGCRFRVRTAMEIWIVKETCLDRFYEEKGFTIQDGWTILDIGAAFGDFAVSIARGHPRSRVYAFEPLPESFARLLENSLLNGTTNVQAFARAVAGRPGTLYLQSSTGLSGQHRTSEEAGVEGIPAIPVSAITLDQAFEELGLRECDFLKIDCEGAEFDILFGTRPETLRKIGRIALEYHDGVTDRSHPDLVRLLEDSGFHVEIERNPVHRHLGLLYASRIGLA